MKRVFQVDPVHSSRPSRFPGSMTSSELEKWDSAPDRSRSETHFCPICSVSMTHLPQIPKACTTHRKIKQATTTTRPHPLSAPLLATGGEMTAKRLGCRFWVASQAFSSSPPHVGPCSHLPCRLTDTLVGIVYDSNRPSLRRRRAGRKCQSQRFGSRLIGPRCLAHFCQRNAPTRRLWVFGA